MERFDVKHILSRLSGPIMLTTVTATTSMTLLVPSPGHRLEIFHIYSSIDGDPPQVHFHDAN